MYTPFPPSEVHCQVILVTPVFVMAPFVSMIMKIVQNHNFLIFTKFLYLTFKTRNFDFSKFFKCAPPFLIKFAKLSAIIINKCFIYVLLRNKTKIYKKFKI